MVCIVLNLPSVLPNSTVQGVGMEFTVEIVLYSMYNIDNCDFFHSPYEFLETFSCQR